jgi:hypothetical protein
MLKHVELNGLCQRTALANGHDITLTYVQKARRAVYRHVGVSLLETSILGDILKVITTNNKSSLHLVGDDHCLKDTATDGHITSEGTLFVDVSALRSLLGSLEAKTDGLGVPQALGCLGTQHSLATYEDSILLLVCILRLICLKEL